MKYLLCVFLLLFVPLTAIAQTGGVIGVYSDEVASDCLLLDNPGPATLHVVQKFTVGSTGSRFRLEFSPGFAGTLASISAVVGSFEGDPIAGLTINYGSCLAGSFEILQIHLMLTGTSPECSWVRVAAHPLSIDGFPDTYDCLSVRAGTYWTGTHIQHDIFRSCPDLGTGEGHGPRCLPYTPPVPVAQSTWGAVKSLYR